MKSILSLLSFFSCLLAFSQSNSEIKDIDKTVKTIKTESKNYDILLLSKKGNDNEISVYQDFFCNVKLIREKYLNENGKTDISTYFGNNHPVYILKEYYTYKYPATDKRYDAAAVTKKEECFYLKDERVIKWMKDKKKVKKYPKNAAAIENNMIEHINGLLTRFQQEYPN